MISFIDISLSMKIILRCFLVHVLVYIDVFIGKFYDLIFRLHDFHSTRIFHLYLLLLLHHYFVQLTTYINHIYIVCPRTFSGYFTSSFTSVYSLNTLFTEATSWWLIYESIKALQTQTLTVFNFLNAFISFS